MRTGSMVEYAAHRRVSTAYVTKLKGQGRLVMVQKEGRSVVNFDLSDRLIDNTADQSRAGSGRNSPATRPDRAATTPEAPEPTPSPGSATMPGGGPATDALFRRAQTQEKVIAAKTADVMFKKLMNELIDRGVVERAVFDAFRELRDHAFQAPQRAALRALGQGDVAEIERVMADELRQAFDGWEARMTERLPAKLTP